MTVASSAGAALRERISRPELSRRIRNALERGSPLVVGDAGFGKTLPWRRHSTAGGRRPAWLAAGPIGRQRHLIVRFWSAFPRAVDVLTQRLFIKLDVGAEYQAELIGKTRVGDVLADALRALWKVPLAEHAVPELDGTVIRSRFEDAIENGGRQSHYLLMGGTSEDSGSDSMTLASIEVVFDATRSGYIDFLEKILPQGLRFRQAGYVSLRPWRAARAVSSMHGVAGTHTMSIEIGLVSRGCRQRCLDELHPAARDRVRRRDAHTRASTTSSRHSSNTLTAIRVFGGKYLRSRPDSMSADNIDELPDC